MIMEASISKRAKVIYCLLAVFADSEQWKAHPKANYICMVLGML